MVFWQHLTHVYPGFLTLSLFTLDGPGAFQELGNRGVTIFFVISGFILPYAMHRAGYVISDYGRFWLRRIIRLEPPYLISVALCIALGGMFAALGGQPFHTSSLQVGLHLGYLNPFFHLRFLNPNYWTLVLEFQYYIIIGLLFPLVAHRSAAVRFAGIALPVILALAAPIDHYALNSRFITGSICFFLIGIVVFQYRAGLISHRWLWLYLGGLIVFNWLLQSWISGIFAAGVGLVIAYCNFNLGRVMTFLGAISYSLYLVHTPVGVGLIRLSRQWNLSSGERVMVFYVAVAASLGAALALWRWVEIPAMALAAHIRYRSRPAVSEFERSS